MKAATKFKLATPAQFVDWRRTVARWKEVPGAFAAVAMGEATGRKA